MSTPLDAIEAKRLIALILDQGYVEYSAHCLRDSMPDRHVTTLDVVHVLRSGHILRDPEWDEDHQEWKYRVEGADIDGDDLTVITVIIEPDLTLIVVTVF